MRGGAQPGAGAHVGKRIIKVCEVIEKNGPCGLALILKNTDYFDPSHAARAIRRAMKYGAVSAEKQKFYVYTIIPGWRDLLEDMPWRVRAKPKPAKMPKRTTLESAWANIAKGTNG